MPVCAENFVRLIQRRNHIIDATMIALLIFLLRVLVLPSKPKRGLEAENAALRRQLAILQRVR
jgi:DMSO/TMAO reductase YedYZ heme-binding membrane subunit